MTISEFLYVLSASMVGTFIGIVLGLGILDFISLIRGEK
jgi:hypothetical protein